MRSAKNSPSTKGWQTFPSSRGVSRRDGVFDRVVKWKDLPYNPDLIEKAKESRKAGNLAEVLFWQRVKNGQFLGLDFDREKIIGDYIVDFFCKDSGFVVEIDGITHDFKVDYDKKRDRYLESLGLKVFHFMDEDIRKNLGGVMEWIIQELSNTPSRTPRPDKSGHPSERREFGTPL